MRIDRGFPVIILISTLLCVGAKTASEPTPSNPIVQGNTALRCGVGPSSTAPALSASRGAAIDSEAFLHLQPGKYPELVASLDEGEQSVIEVMVIYTPYALSLASYGGMIGEAAMNALIDAAENEANTVFENSQVNCRVHVVHKEMVNYSESGDMTLDLTRLQFDGDGYMDEVHRMRDEHAADLVCLATGNGQFAGQAQLLTDPTGPDNDKTGFSVLLWYSLTPGGAGIFPHEIAHNLGCQHAREQANSRGVFDFSYGYHFVGQDGVEYATMESAATGKLIPYFSNPRVLFRGTSAGLEAGDARAADNAKTINNTAPIVAAYRPVVGVGLKGQYYDDRNLTDLELTRIDPTINFNWKKRAPHPLIGANSFSVRWTGQVQPLYSESYTFYTVSNDGIRLWVNGELIIDSWNDHEATENTGAISLVAGRKYSLKVEYYDNRGKATATLSWSSATQSREIIPTSRLYAQ